MTGERIHTVGHQLRPDQLEVDREFVRRLHTTLSEPAVVVTHEASRFFAPLYFLRREFIEHLGLFIERQVTFDHKPWVECGLRNAGLRVLPWRYLATFDPGAVIGALAEALRTGPVVVRRNRSDGGRGLTLLRHTDEIPGAVQDADSDGFIAMAPFLDPSIPLNVNACIFPDGSLSLHGPSLQLIGIPGTALSRFNYCGNDFARVRDLDPAVLRALQELAVGAGRWLFSMGYVGAFGVDALLHQGTVYLTEVNPRFQGSSLLSAHLDLALDRPDVYLTHAAAFLGLPPPGAWDLRDLAREQPQAAQIFARNVGGLATRNAASWASGEVDCWMLPDPGVSVHSEALLCRAIARTAVTVDGWGLHADAAAWFAELPGRLFDAVQPTGVAGR
jgi:hypothetical protein